MMHTEENIKHSGSAKAGSGKPVHNGYRIVALVTALVLLLTCSFTALAANNCVDSDDAIHHRLWGFFVGWAENDTERMVSLCIPDWAGSVKNPQEELLSILGAKAPLSYQVNSISGTYGDPIRNVVCTLESADSTPEKPLYRELRMAIRLEEDRLYAVVPVSLYYRDGENIRMDPAAETVSLDPNKIEETNLLLHTGISLWDLSPINQVVESSGIRFELISGRIERNSAAFYCSVQDMEGKYDGLNLDASFDTDIGPFSSAGYHPVKEDKVQHKIWYVYTPEFSTPVSSSDRNITFSMSSVRIEEEQNFVLAPLLEEYGAETDGIVPPSSVRSYRDNSVPLPQDLKVLDYTHPLDVPLFRDMSLSGIGWIDGQLHVQFHCAEPARLQRGGTVWNKWYAWMYCYDQDAEYSPLEWDGKDAWDAEWMEYILNTTPEQVREKYLQVDVSELVDALVDDAWSITVPFSTLWAGNDEAAESAAEPEPEPEPDVFSSGNHTSWTIECDLREFFAAWAEGSLNSMLEKTTIGWRLAEKDPEAFLTKLIAGGTPLSYQVSSISRAPGNSSRIADCVVEMDLRDGSTPRYERVQVPLLTEHPYNIYTVDPSGLADREPAEPLPDKEVVSLSEEAIINWNLDYFFPGVRNKLIPVHLSAEDQGIRLEILSALVQDQESWIVYSLEDTKGRYTGCDFHPNVNTDIGDLYSFSPFPLYANAAQHRSVHMINVRYGDPVGIEDRTVTFSLYGLSDYKTRFMDMSPLIAQYAVTTEGVTPPANVYGLDKNAEPGSLKVLDWTTPLDIPVTKDGFLTGIGWIDGKLHIQFRSDSFSFHNAQFTEYDGTRADTKSWFDGNRIFWAADGSTFIEHVINYDPDDPAHTHLEGSLDYTEELLPNLSLNIPLNLSDIRAKDSGTEPAAESAAETATAEPAEEPETELSFDRDFLAGGTSAEDTVPDILREKYPLIADRLKPVGVSCMNRGIRMTLDSALVAGNESWALVTLEATEGDLFTFGYYPSEMTLDTDIGKPDTYSWYLLHEDPDNRKLTYLFNTSYTSLSHPYNALYTFTLRDLSVQGTSLPEEWQVQVLYTTVLEKEEPFLSVAILNSLKTRFPEIANDLKPVNLVSEKDGIRAEILSVLVRGDESWTLFSLQDLEGGRFKYFDGETVDLSDPVDASLRYSVSTDTLYRDSVSRKAVFLRHCTYSSPIDPDSSSGWINISQIVLTDRSHVDLVPYLKQYMDTAKAVEPPEYCMYSYGYTTYAGDEDVKVLDYTRPLNVPLNDNGNILLTGIGWADGKLQVQLHNTADHARQYETFTYPVWYAHVIGYSYANGRFAQTDLSPVIWSDPDENWNSWLNFIFDISPEEIGNIDLYAEINHYVDVLSGGWSFELPQSVLQPD